MFFNNVPESLEQNLAAHRRPRRPEVLQPLPLGLDLGRQHALPALEAGDLPRRDQRSLHRPLAEGHHGQGRGPHPVRPRHRHGADRARRAGHRATGQHPRRHAVADRGRLASPTPSTTPRRPRSTSPSTSRCSATARSTTTAGGRSAPGPATSFAESGRRFGTPIPAATLTELDATGWELYHVAEDFAENHDVAADNRAAADRDDRPVVRRGRQVQRAADRRPRPAALRRGAAADRRRADALRLLSGHAGGGRPAPPRAS